MTEGRIFRYVRFLKEARTIFVVAELDSVSQPSVFDKKIDSVRARLYP